ncbi:MAG: hypothetical protein ABJN26_25405 [Stappiaceae bacterium]
MNAESKLVAEYDGKCAFAAFLKKDHTDLPPGNPKTSVTVDGKTYLFLNPVARALWKLFASPSGKLKRWIMLIVIVGALVWGISMLLGMG